MAGWPPQAACGVPGCVPMGQRHVLQCLMEVESGRSPGQSGHGHGHGHGHGSSSLPQAVRRQPPPFLCLNLLRVIAWPVLVWVTAFHTRPGRGEAGMGTLWIFFCFPLWTPACPGTGCSHAMSPTTRHNLTAQPLRALTVWPEPLMNLEVLKPIRSVQKTTLG